MIVSLVCSNSVKTFNKLDIDGKSYYIYVHSTEYAT